VIENILQVDELRALARAKMKSFAQKSVPPRDGAAAVQEGWTILKAGKTSVRLRKQKDGHELLKDRVWSLLYKMQMDFMSSSEGALIKSASSEASDLRVDVVAIDNEVCLAIQCISQDSFRRSSTFARVLENLCSARERLSKNVGKMWPLGHKRNVVLALFIENVQLQDKEREVAQSQNVIIFDEQDLDYYEKLNAHIATAAKYQLYADLLQGKTVPGLAIRVPAVRTRMGPLACYTFPISPEYLLKIAYVSHRSKGKASDVHTYQRMLTKVRLQKIREYISSRGIFPTNIVINVDKRFMSFQRVRQEGSSDESDASGLLGWLTIKPAYKSAWVIDGQHRLFAYSGHEYAKTGHLSVLAFEGITPSAQAKLFVDINAKQKSVKSSLLQELFAELHWDADSPTTRVQAIISKAVQTLGAEKDSPFLGRIQTADLSKDNLRCISLASVFRSLERHGFFIEEEQHNEVVRPGPFWAGNNDKTLNRTVFFVKSWFREIANAAPDWWNAGAGDGGGLAMNDSVVACVNVLHSVLQHLQKNRQPLARMDKDALWALVLPYAKALGAYLASFSGDARQKYRDLRGSQGQTTRARRAQQALKESFPAFDPSGLEDFLSREKEQTNLKGKAIIDRLEVLIKKMVLQELKQEFGDQGDEWWLQGIPKAVRLEAVTRSEKDDKQRGAREAYFDLIDYRTIVQGQWQLFQPLFGFGKKNENKERATKWMVDLNDMRKVVAHSSSGISLTMEQLAELQNYEVTLKQRSASLGQSVEEVVEVSDE